MLSISSGLLFLVITFPKVIDVGSIDRFKKFRDDVLLNYVDTIKSLDSKGDKLQFIKEEIYPLTAYVSSLWNFIEKWDKYQNYVSKLLLSSSILWFLTIFAPLEFDLLNYKINLISIILWGIAVELLFLGILFLIQFIKSRNKFINTINKLELNEITIDDIMNEKKKIYKSLLKKGKFL